MFGVSRNASRLTLHVSPHRVGPGEQLEARTQQLNHRLRIGGFKTGNLQKVPLNQNPVSDRADQPGAQTSVITIQSVTGLQGVSQSIKARQGNGAKVLGSVIVRQHRAQNRQRRDGLVLQPAPQPVEQLLDHLLGRPRRRLLGRKFRNPTEQRLFGPEVVHDQPTVDPGGRSDCTNGRPFVAEISKHPPSSFKNASLGVTPLLSPATHPFILRPLTGADHSFYAR